jgi:Holliday junction resolvase
MESKIQANIKARFERAGWMVIKLIQTNCNGIPDLMCLKNGKTIFIEVKQPGREPTELQKYRHAELIKQGFQVYVLTSEKDIII